VALLWAANCLAATVTQEVAPAPRSLVPETLRVERDSPLAEMEKTLRGRLADDPADAQAWHALGTVLFHAGRQGDAVTAWAKAHELDLAFAPAEVMRDVQAALQVAAAGDTAAARDRFAEAESRHDGNPWFQMMRAEQAMRGRAYAEAEAAYRRAAQLGPDLFLTNLNLGRMLDFLGRHDEARAAYVAATAAAPDRAAPWDFIAAHQFRQGDAAAAADSLARAEAADPRQPLAEVRMAELSLGGRDLVGARHWYRRALARATAGQDAIRVALSDVQMRLGLDDEARATLDAVLASGEAAPVLVARGWLDEKAGDMEAAVRRYRRAIMVDPGNIVAANNLAMVLIKLGRGGDEALVHARYAFERQPNNGAVFGTHALALAVTGQPEAPAVLARAVRVDPADPWLRWQHARQLDAAGQAEAAQVHYEACAILDPAFPHRAECAGRVGAP
jgi:Tfp pilus assembly protein PilF